MWSEILVGIVSGLGASVLSVFAFRAQNIWERKNAAYKELLEALQQMKAANDEEYNDEITYRSMTKERSAHLREVWQRGKVIAYKYADIGAMDTNSEIEAIMEKLREELDNHEEFHSFFEAIDHQGAAIGRALKSAKAIAIRDAQNSGFRLVPKWLSSIRISERKPPLEAA